jgi:hypothetical protein
MHFVVVCQTDKLGGIKKKGGHRLWHLARKERGVGAKLLSKN